MFEPRIYKKNGLEAFRLVGSDGSEFFYEGAIDCDEKVLYKDNLGRLYYPVTSSVGGAVNYFVELDPQVQHIPFDEEGRKEKDISRLINASPRMGASLPDDIYVVPETPEAIPLEEVAPDTAAPEASVPEMAAPEAAQESAPEKLPEEQPAVVPVPQEATPQQAPEEPAMKPEASSAIHAIFSPKVDILHPPAEQQEKVAVAEKADPPAQAKAANKKRSLKWPLAVLAIIVLLAACAIGVYVVRPDAYDSIRALYTHPTVTPGPTAAPTEEPTPVPTATPAPEPANNIPAPEFSSLIDSDNAAVVAFLQNTNGTSKGNGFKQTCDLFDYVNMHWQSSDNYTELRKASEIIASLEGTRKDYTILMCALTRALGMESRPVFSYIGDDLHYYPEVLASNTSAGYQTTLQELHTRYGLITPQGHSDDSGYWISLDMGNYPGLRPSSPTAEYTLYNGLISPINVNA